MSSNYDDALTYISVEGKIVLLLYTHAYWGMQVLQNTTMSFKLNSQARAALRMSFILAKKVLLQYCIIHISQIW